MSSTFNFNIATTVYLFVSFYNFARDHGVLQYFWLFNSEIVCNISV